MEALAFWLRCHHSIEWRWSYRFFTASRPLGQDGKYGSEFPCHVFRKGQPYCIAAILPLVVLVVDAWANAAENISTA